ncbi:MAG: putative metal-binding motif-containing protein [Myxococcota bacterium]|nr:putative metal-binding motif-containing protein [Myxococcota bacterium]
MSRALALLSVLAGCNGPDTQIGTYTQEPDLTIVSPPDGSEYNEGEVINFEALVNDDIDAPGELLLVWSSDVDGELLTTGTADADGGVLFATANLTAGYTHTVTLQATDSDALTNSSSVTITIIELPDAPELSIVQPAAGQSGVEGEEFDFKAQVFDSKDAPEDLLVTITTDGEEGRFCAPVPDATGLVSCPYTLSPAVHGLVFTVEDSEGFTDSSTVYFTVVAGSEIDDDEDGWTESQGDCDDDNPNVNPNVEEYANGIDDNCDGNIDEGTNGYDDDGDGYSEDQGDCDDGNVDVNPGETEICDNNRDDNCDGSEEAEDAIDCTTYYRDYDGDGYGSSTDKCLCGPDGDYTVQNSSDCYDYNADANPTQGGYYSTSRGDGSYDYDCDSSETRYDTSSGVCSGAVWICSTSTTGWSGSIPSCGASSDYVTDCDANFLSCDEVTSAVSQSCK